MESQQHPMNISYGTGRGAVHLVQMRFNPAKNRMSFYRVCNAQQDVDGPQWNSTNTPATCKRCLKKVHVRLEWESYPGAYDNVTRWAATDAHGNVHSVEVAQGEKDGDAWITAEVYSPVAQCLLREPGLASLAAGQFACERYASEHP